MLEVLVKLITDYEFTKAKNQSLPECPLCGHEHYACNNPDEDAVKAFAEYLHDALQGSFVC